MNKKMNKNAPFIIGKRGKNHQKGLNSVVVGSGISGGGNNLGFGVLFKVLGETFFPIVLKLRIKDFHASRSGVGLFL